MSGKIGPLEDVQNLVEEGCKQIHENPMLQLHMEEISVPDHQLLPGPAIHIIVQVSDKFADLLSRFRQIFAVT